MGKTGAKGGAKASTKGAKGGAAGGGEKGAKGGGRGGKKEGGDLKNFSQVKARHILTDKEQKCRDAYAVIQQDFGDKAVPGSKFGLLAEKVSECSSAKKGGNLGWFPRGKMVGEFETKAFSTPVGEVSAPFKTTNGWHILLVEGRKA